MAKAGDGARGAPGTPPERPNLAASFFIPTISDHIPPSPWTDIPSHSILYPPRRSSQLRSPPQMANKPAPLPLSHSDPNLRAALEDELYSAQRSSSSFAAGAASGYYSDSSFAGESSPYMSPWNQTMASPWSSHLGADIAGEDADSFGDGGSSSAAAAAATGSVATTLVGSLVREEGHIYSLAAVGDALYTGSDSKNIRVWRKQKDAGGFKSSSGLVKAIVISGERIFTGHQDGKIRVWRMAPPAPAKGSPTHKRVGSLPRLRDFLRGSLNPSNYVETKRNRSALWIRHTDAVSCLAATGEDAGILYSGSWDRTFKVWRVSDSKCLESVHAHDDNINTIVAGFDVLVVTGSADGTVKVWRREMGPGGRSTKHSAVQTLLKQEYAVNALAVSPPGSPSTVLYCGTSDGVVNFWEGDKRQQLVHGGVLRGHKKAVFCLTTAGKLLLSGSADHTIFVWRRGADGAHSCLAVLTGHTEPIKCLAIAADDEGMGGGSGAGGPQWIVYSGSLDKSVKVWRVSEGTSPETLF